MTIEFGQATSAEEIEAVQRQRYEVYVGELGRYKGVADGNERRFAEPEDETSWIFYARDGDRVVASLRGTWGGHGLSERQIAQYQMQPFLDEIPVERVLVGERYASLPAYRGMRLLEGMMEQGRELIESHDVRIVFGCCEPHLLSMYVAMGQRPYADQNINSPEAGYMIPLVTFVPDVEAVRGIGRGTRPDELPQCVERVVERSGSVRSQVLTSGSDYWHEIHDSLHELHAQQISAFDDFTDDEAQRCIDRSNIIECQAGDRVLKRGGAARNIFVVLSGTLEVLDGDRVVGVLSAGDAFGEMAFLLERPRAFDVDAATDGTRVLCLSEKALRTMIAEEPTIAAKLLLNVSKMLCVRLIKAD